MAEIANDLKAAFAALCLALATLEVIVFAPRSTLSDGIHYFLLDEASAQEREISREEFCHGDRLLVIEVADGEIREAFTCRMVVEFPNTISMREFSPLTPEQASDALSTP